MWREITVGKGARGKGPQAGAFLTPQRAAAVLVEEFRDFVEREHPVLPRMGMHHHRHAHRRRVESSQRPPGQFRVKQDGFSRSGHGQPIDFRRVLQTEREQQDVFPGAQHLLPRPLGRPGTEDGGDPRKQGSIQGFDKPQPGPKPAAMVARLLGLRSQSASEQHIGRSPGQMSARAVRDAEESRELAQAHVGGRILGRAEGQLDRDQVRMGRHQDAADVFLIEWLFSGHYLGRYRGDEHRRVPVASPLARRPGEHRQRDEVALYHVVQLRHSGSFAEIESVLYCRNRRRSENRP